VSKTFLNVLFVTKSKELNVKGKPLNHNADKLKQFVFVTKVGLHRLKFDKYIPALQAR